MNAKKLDAYKHRLEADAARLTASAASLEDVARGSTGGDAHGGSSNAPMHLADIGSEMYNQELNSALLEGEEHSHHEITEALRRIEAGTFGTCENCGKAIPEGRLDALPQARHCVACAEALASSPPVNMNEGRPGGWGSTLDHPEAAEGRKRSGETSPFTAGKTPAGERKDQHAAGTPGGGSAVGGLAGTNTADGDPDDENLEDAMGSGEFDEKERDEERQTGDTDARTPGGIKKKPAKAKKPAAKKAVAKKPTAKKVVAKKAPVKKSPVKKATAKKR